MKLEKEKRKTFFEIYYPLLSFANKELNLFELESRNINIRDVPLDIMLEIRNNLFDNPEIIDDFIKKNPENFKGEKIEILEKWKNFVEGRFIVVKHLKKHTVFLEVEEPQRAYGVIGLEDEPEELIASTPQLLQTVLLPFDENIIYDGIFGNFGLGFGSNMKKEVNEVYLKAKSKHGIITSLPYSEDEEEWTDEDRLRFYLRNKHNREKYESEINSLANKNPSLRSIYYKKMGKIFSCEPKKNLKDFGFSDVWFAVLDENIVASGSTKEKLEENLKSVVPKEKRDWVYVFKLD